MPKPVGHALLVVLLFTVSCGGNGATSPTTISSGASSCRNYASNSTTLTTTSGGATTTRTQSCAYDTVTNQLNCTMTLSLCGTVPFSLTYASVSDFVREASVIPPRMLQMSQTTAPNGCNVTDGAFSYDAQKRLVQYTMNGLTYRYSSWDANGRPTRGTVTGGAEQTWTYNDATRTATLVQTDVVGSVTTVFTYDTNGNVASVVVNAGRDSSTSTTTTTTTAEVCS
jgi:YD repeat-containing protein